MNLLQRHSIRLAVVIVLFVLVAVAPLLMTPFVNFQLSMVAVFAVAIMGLNILMGYAGQISLGQSAFLGLGAYVTAFGVLREWPVAVTFVLACLIPGATGFLIALPASRLRGYSIAMVTVTLPIIAIPLAKRFPAVTGGSQGLNTHWMMAPVSLGLADDQWRYYVIVIIAVLFFVVARNLLKGRLGRAFAIVRDNELVASSMGISTYRYKVMAFTIASIYGGAAGFLYLIAVQYTSPETFSFLVAINLLAAMVIGGKASIAGSVIGGGFYVLIPYLAGQANGTQTGIYSGAALLIVLFVVPGGLVTLPRVITRIISRSRRPARPTRLPPTNPPREGEQPDHAEAQASV